MERNPTNKVYINPNFKGPLERGGEKNTWPSIIDNNSFTNKKRTIYFNPNFKHNRQEQNLLLNATSTGKCEKYENKYNQTFISKSKYSLVSDTTKVTRSNDCREINSENSAYKTTDSFYNQSNKNQTILVDIKPKGVPVVKSRYCIVRKKKLLSDHLEENKPKTIGTDMTKYSVPAPAKVKSSPITCYSNINRSMPINQKNAKPLEKITKIKLSKYKTVPITYLKNIYNSTRDNEHKLNNLQLQAKCEKHIKFQYPTLQTIDINRFKLTRPSTKLVGNTTKVISKINLQSDKSVWNNQNKKKLTKESFKLNNIPCRLFNKYGKCLRKDYGKCEYLHDKKHVSLCRKFLKGICHDNNCPLSHEVTANKMPTCYFYLNGVCTKENCPYVHIKLSDKIKICQSFLRGYCEKGDSCTFRHVNVQKFKKLNSTVNLDASGNMCKNTKVKKSKVKSNIKKKNIAPSNNLKQVKILNTEGNDIEGRYYKEMVSSEGSCENIKPSRCKLGTLPSFIQL